MNSRLAAAAYVAVTCVIGRNVLTSVGTAIASDAGDPLLNAAILVWNATHTPWSDAWFQFPIFYPTRDALTLSEHLLGLSVLATPLYWATGNPAAAYNLTLLLTYPLSGMAMYALVWRITRSSPAAFVAGLAFAFAPYRAGQLPHIQMLALFWAPLALLGLHGFADSEAWPDFSRSASKSQARPHFSRQRWRWLILFAVCWALQGAANGYMLVYFSLLVGGWVLWFLVARGRWRDTLWVGAAAAAASLPLLPILYRYTVTHRELGLSRNIGEISAYSADVAALLCAPSTLTIWGWLRVTCAPEGELFPGLGLIALTFAAIVFLKPPSAGNAHASPPRLRASTVRGGIRIGAVAVAVLFLGIVVSVWLVGAWRIDLGWFRASASSADKPLSVALALLLVAFLLSDGLRAAVARGSTVTFYVGAAVVCWILAWGPFPRLFGTPILYQAPYAWLLQLPGVDALRVPARFWMVTVLCLSVSAGLIVARLRRDRGPRNAAAPAALAAAVLLLDGWVTIPAATVPPPPAAASSVRSAPVLVSPVGDLFRDAAVVYHAVAGGWTAINGYSGYEPGYYEALRTLSQSMHEAQYAPFVRLADIEVVDGHDVRRLPARPSPVPIGRLPGRRLSVTVRDASCETTNAAAAVDGDPDTGWLCGTQTADHSITLDTGERADVHALVHALGSAGAGFPRHLVVETSLDRVAWEPAWEGSPAAAVLEAALSAPRETRVVIPFTPRAARYVRLTQTGRHETAYWAIAELEVWSR